MKTYNQLKRLWTGLLIAIAFSGCGRVTVYDAEWCGDLGPYGAHCAHTLTDATRDIPKAQWDALRPGYLCANSTGYNNTETTIDQLCATTKLCDYAQMAAAKLRIKKLITFMDGAL